MNQFNPYHTNKTTMMSAQELRIKNIILHESGKIVEVVGIDLMDVNVILDDHVMWVEVGQFSGIPLSPSLLERAGFSKVDETSLLHE